MKQMIELNVNDEVHELAVEPYDSLLRTLREKAGMTGTKKGCTRQVQTTTQTPTL